MSQNVTIECRTIIEINTDPQRRCYYGCHFSTALVWSDWTVLDIVPKGRIERRLQFWKELNDYAVSERGESARKEFRIVA